VLIRCPNCGERLSTEYWCAGELRPAAPPPSAAGSLESEFARLWVRKNVAGVHRERWFHFAGCRRWLTLTRDTATNAVLSEGVQTPRP